MEFKNDPKDRKRRFLRGLNHLLELKQGHLEDTEITLEEALSESHITLSEFRTRLANTYGLGYTPKEIQSIVKSEVTTGQFTENTYQKIYASRGRVDLNTLATNAVEIVNSQPAVNLAEIERVFKYGLNGSKWCDVTEGPCNCGAWH